VVIDGSNGMIESWIDGTPAETQSSRDTLPSRDYRWLRVGAPWTAGGQDRYRFWVDEVAFDDAPIPCMP
jgi:hypothetical protein